MTDGEAGVAVQAPEMAGADGAHGRRRRRRRPPCDVPGCTTRPRYVCVHYEANSPLDPSMAHDGTAANHAPAGDPGLQWFCKAHKCRRCKRIDDDAEQSPEGAADVARIADTARAALVRLWQDSGGATDPHITYGFQAILELCGPDHGEVRICACGHTLSAHYVGFGRCTMCPDDSPCRAMRRSDAQADENDEEGPAAPDAAHHGRADEHG